MLSITFAEGKEKTLIEVAPLYSRFGLVGYGRQKAKEIKGKKGLEIITFGSDCKRNNAGHQLSGQFYLN